MLQNLAFYENMDDLMLNFDPRPDAKTYHGLVAMETKMLDFAKRHFWNEDAEEVMKRLDGMLNRFDVDEGYEGDEEEEEEEEERGEEGRDGREEFLQRHGYKSRNDLGRRDIFVKAEHVLNDAKKYAEEARRYRQILAEGDRPKAQLLKNVLGNGLRGGEGNDTTEEGSDASQGGSEGEKDLVPEAKEMNEMIENNSDITPDHWHTIFLSFDRLCVIMLQSMNNGAM